jgi:hypothetical protein
LWVATRPGYRLIACRANGPSGNGEHFADVQPQSDSPRVPEAVNAGVRDAARSEAHVRCLGQTEGIENLTGELTLTWQCRGTDGDPSHGLPHRQSALRPERPASVRVEFMIRPGNGVEKRRAPRLSQRCVPIPD